MPSRRRAFGPLPTLDEFASAIAKEALSAAPAQDTVYVEERITLQPPPPTLVEDRTPR